MNAAIKAVCKAVGVEAKSAALYALWAVFAVTMFVYGAPNTRQTYPNLKINGKENPDVYLQSLDVTVDVTGNIASTRYTMVFKNKTARVLEGELTFPLPDGRTVTYYALDINGKMREAVPVEKAKATRVFEEIEQRQVDPGLLERVEGNNFRTRIYPIPSGGTRTISVGYEGELTLEKELLQYRLPMDYPNPIEKFAVKATVWKSSVEPIVPASNNEIRFERADENYVATFTRKNYRPARALNFSLPAPADIPQIITQPAQGGFYFFASVAPKAETRKKKWNNDLAIIWDVSLSGSQRDIERELELLNVIFTKKKNVNVYLYYLNNTFTKMVNKKTANGEHKVINGNWDGLRNTLKKAVFDGGTDFSKIYLNGVAGNEILFFSDGISTLSDADFIKNAGVAVKRPIHCIVSSAKADYSAAKLIAGRTNGKFINLNALSSDELNAELLNETLQFLGVEHGESVREIYPSIATPVHGNFSLSGISETNDAELTLLFGFGDTVEKKITVKLDAKKAADQTNARKLWAQKKIAELDLNYERNRGELTELGQQFGIVTRNTSLIVLETVDDYIRYNIEPPAELAEEYRRRQEKHESHRHAAESNLLIIASGTAKNIKTWWETDFSLKKSTYPTPDSAVERSSNARDTSGTRRRFSIDERRKLSEDEIRQRIRELERERDIEKARREHRYLHGPRAYAPRDNDTSKSMAFERKEAVAPAPVIRIKPIKKDNEYLNKLTGKTAEDYKIYLKLRDEYASSPTFYFDMAEWFYTHDDKKLALRILTSIADLDLENASLYRLLGYRFKEYGEYALEKFVCKKVILWRPMEPQSYRDYALALSDNGEKRAALDSLYGLLTKTYSGNLGGHRRGIEEVVITEINNLLARNAKLNKSKIDTSVITNIPVDIRVVINWNMNNADIDLHVKDPNNEECYYGHRETKIGGRITSDNRNGYGPEQFLLKKAVKGKYRIYVNYFSDRRFTDAGPLTVMAEIYTKYADKTEQRRVVCLQMSTAKQKDGKTEVAEFEF